MAVCCCSWTNPPLYPLIYTYIFEYYDSWPSRRSFQIWLLFFSNVFNLFSNTPAIFSRVRWDGSLLLQLDQPSSLSLHLYNSWPSMGNFHICLLLFSKIFNLYCNTPAISYCLGKKKTKSYGREGQISVLRNLSSTLALVMAMLGLLFIGLAWLKVARVGSESDLPWWISFKIDKSCNESSYHSKML